LSFRPRCGSSVHRSDWQHFQFPSTPLGETGAKPWCSSAACNAPDISGVERGTGNPTVLVLEQVAVTLIILSSRLLEE